ncbi:hypothetical protein [Sulfurimonas sp.]|uniref:hypothetical protein n=1 Tax=Sulfurimonas sp. TaxID=2022749 RepID=UPI00356A765B
MKSILLLLMLTTMLFSNEKQIIVGSFLQEKNALNSLVKLNNHILRDDKLSALINKNSVEVKLKKIGEYHAASLSPFTSYVQLLRTLRALESYYDDAYVLDNGQKITISQVEAKKVVEEKTAPVKEKSEKSKEVKNDDSVGVKTHAQIKAPVKHIEEEKDYTLEIVLALLVLLGVGYIIFKTSKQRKDVKEDENL